MNLIIIITALVEDVYNYDLELDVNNSANTFFSKLCLYLTGLLSFSPSFKIYFEVSYTILPMLKLMVF